jgi:mRNA interferase MazF
MTPRRFYRMVLGRFPIKFLPAFAVVFQGDSFNQSRISTAVCVPLTSNLLRAESPGNVLLPARLTGLPRDSVANVSQIVSLDRRLLAERVGKLQYAKLQLVLAGIDTLPGR